MNRDSYGDRLREIREKYGTNVKDTTTCLRSFDRPIINPDTRYDDKFNKNKKPQAAYNRISTENIDPYTTGFTSKYSNPTLNSTLNSKDPLKKYDSTFLSNTQNRDQRLKEIEKIRENFAESRKRAINQWTREVQNSKNKYVQEKKYSCHQKSKAPLSLLNTNSAAYNPEDLKYGGKQLSFKESFRNRVQSSYAPKHAQDKQLTRSYDYQAHDYQNIKTKEYNESALKSIRSNNLTAIDRQNIAYSNTKQFNLKDFNTKDFAPKDYRAKQYDHTLTSKSMRHIQSQTVSPIRGLTKFDSLQKNLQPQISIEPGYNLSSIDNIQQRIQKILAKK